MYESQKNLFARTSGYRNDDRLCGLRRWNFFRIDPEPVVETVTDKVYDGFGTFTGTTVDGKPTEGKLVTDEYTYEGTFEDGFNAHGNGKADL